MNLMDKVIDVLCFSYVRNRHMRRLCVRSGLGLSLTFVMIMMLLTSPEYFVDNAGELVVYTLLLFYLPFVVVAILFFSFNRAKNSPTAIMAARIFFMVCSPCIDSRNDYW